MEKEYEYIAFISYKRPDKDKNSKEITSDNLAQRIAIELQKRIQRFKQPKDVTALGKERKVFVDKNNMRGNESYDRTVRKALASSKYLIVLGNEKYMNSKYCRDEVTYFLNKRSKVSRDENHDSQHIIPILLSGTPTKSFPRSVFADIPDRIYFDLRADTPEQAFKNLNQELGKIIAVLGECEPDKIIQQEKKHKRRINAIIGLAVAMFICGILAFAITTAQNNKSLYISQSKYLSQLSSQLLDEGNQKDAIKVALSALPKSEGDHSRPLVNDAVYALGNSLNAYDNKEKYIINKTIKHPFNADVQKISPSGKKMLVYAYTLNSNADDEYLVSVTDIKSKKNKRISLDNNDVLHSIDFIDDNTLIVECLHSIFKYDIAKSKKLDEYIIDDALYLYSYHITNDRKHIFLSLKKNESTQNECEKVIKLSTSKLNSNPKEYDISNNSINMSAFCAVDDEKVAYFNDEKTGVLNLKDGTITSYDTPKNEHSNKVIINSYNPLTPATVIYRGKSLSVFAVNNVIFISDSESGKIIYSKNEKSSLNYIYPIVEKDENSRSETLKIICGTGDGIKEISASDTKITSKSHFESKTIVKQSSKQVYYNESDSTLIVLNANGIKTDIYQLENNFKSNMINDLSVGTVVYNENTSKIMSIARNDCAEHYNVNTLEHVCTTSYNQGDYSLIGVVDIGRRHIVLLMDTKAKSIFATDMEKDKELWRIDNVDDDNEYNLIKSNNQKQLVIIGDRTTIINCKNGKIIKQAKNEFDAIHYISNRHNWVAIENKNGYWDIKDYLTKKTVAKTKLPTGYHTVLFSKNDKYLITLNNDGCLCSWDIKKSKMACETNYFYDFGNAGLKTYLNGTTGNMFLAFDVPTQSSDVYTINEKNGNIEKKMHIDSSIKLITPSLYAKHSDKGYVENGYYYEFHELWKYYTVDELIKMGKKAVNNEELTPQEKEKFNIS